MERGKRQAIWISRRLYRKKTNLLFMQGTRGASQVKGMSVTRGGDPCYGGCRLNERGVRDWGQRSVGGKRSQIQRARVWGDDPAHKKGFSEGGADVVVRGGGMWGRGGENLQ